ncbi:MAG: hypothetical protein B6U72_02940 [Candidatus Altiarchaeales archaeon ex4484_2]|nr:MAG: hypothetical protein B6U72_02940 [Candidatus Altiarchaeales archaeon ex4484_2]
MINLDYESKEKLKETLLVLTIAVGFITLGGLIQTSIGNTSSIGMFFAMLWGWMIFSALFIFFLGWRTNAFTEALAQLRRRPATIFLPKAGNGRLQIPNKIKDGWAWFKPRKGLMKGYTLTTDCIFKIGKTDYGLAFEDKAAIIPPKILDCAINLRDAGFDNMTTAEIAMELANIEKEYNIELDADTKAIETTNSKGVREITPLYDLVSDRMNNKFVDYTQDIHAALQNSEQKRTKNIWKDLYAMKQFFTYDITPGVIEEFEASIRAEEQEKARQGLFGNINPKTAVFFIIIVMGLVTAWIMLAQTHSLDGVVNSIQGVGSGTKIT